MRTRIIFEDRDIIVVYKPAGLATQTSSVGQADVVSELKNHIAADSSGGGKNPANSFSGGKGHADSFGGGKNQPYLGVVHRLDQPVEGLLVFAKNKNAASALTRQLTAQGDSATLNKRYYAVFGGEPRENAGKLVDYLRKDSQTGKAVVVEKSSAAESQAIMKVPGTEKSQARVREFGMAEDQVTAEAPGIAEGSATSKKTKGSKKEGTTGQRDREAVLRYQVLETVRTSGETISLAEIQIDTGRFHQIRAQMAHAGMALLGDEKYGDEISRACSGKLGIRTVALCACSLEFLHPRTGKNMSFDIKPETRAFSYFKP